MSRIILTKRTSVEIDPSAFEEIEVVQGEPGPQGPQGEKGEKGDPGEVITITGQVITGPQGVQGERGEQGPAGQDGKDGADGQRGPAGLPGRDGFDGKDGLPGRDGVDGKNGIDGKDGAQGPQGIPGAAGQDGAIGPAGPQGVAGAAGIQGVPGIGIKGFASGYVNAGVFVTLDNLKATVTTTGNRGLSVATVSGTMVLAISATYSCTGGGNGHSTAWPGATYTTTPSGSWFGYHFPNAGDGSTYIANDYTNQKVYRITLMIGPGYSNNFISIERLY